MEEEASPYFTSGFTNQEVAVNKSFFSHDGDINQFTVSLKATNGDGILGLSKIFMKVNQGPVNGSCNISPREGIAVLENFELLCLGWEDPEEAGIRHYSVSCELLL